MRLPQLPRYGPAARWYDLLSGERPVYRAGREAGIARLGLHQESRVLDVGCGTGLNFPRLRELAGAGGAVVGVDASAAMLRVATQRIEDNGWTNVAVHQADAGELAAILPAEEPLDAVLFTYSLFIIAPWRAAFAQARGLLRPGGRLV
ncbi:MAG: class I SAM-dependent methyltransferase, partial [Mycobacteriaceae bacterium]